MFPFSWEGGGVSLLDNKTFHISLHLCTVGVSGSDGGSKVPVVSRFQDFKDGMSPGEAPWSHNADSSEESSWSSW